MAISIITDEHVSAADGSRRRLSMHGSRHGPLHEQPLGRLLGRLLIGPLFVGRWFVGRPLVGRAPRLLLGLLAVAFSAIAAIVPTGNASAAEITFVSVVGTWRDPVDNVPGSQPGDPVITNGDPISSISWGTTSGSQSGYDFIATLPPPFTLPGPIPFFSLGTFQHRNFEVDDPSLVSVELDVMLVLAVDGVPTGPLTFTFTLNHEETPNNLDPCPYPTPPGDGCTDRVTIVASADPTTFNVDGVDYTLEMSFLDNGSPVDEFITAEGDIVNSTGLVGDFTLPPGLTVTKTGPATMRLAEWGNFVIGAQNESESDAYSATLIDRLPDGPTGGMCDTTPEIQSVRVFAADGVTPIPGKGPLVQGTDYSLAYDGTTCELTLTTMTAASAASVIAVGERLMIAYRTQLDADSQDGVTLTNVAGATQWFNADASTEYRRTLTDGTVGVGDHEDAHTVTVDLPVLRFEKTVVNVTTGEDPGTVATPGDTLRYRLYVENLGDVAIDNFRIVDELDSLNANPSFQAGTLNVVTLPPGADAGNTDANGGAAGTGLLDVRNLSIGGLGDSVLIEFEVNLAPVLANGSYVSNQSQLLDNGLAIALSDDPNINGAADPNVADDDDPTQILIESAPAFDIDKLSSYIDGNPNVLLAGETLRYTITVQNIGTDNATGVEIVDQVPANTTYVAGSTTLNGIAVADVNGGSPLTDGILINAPQDTTPGAMNAAVADNVATIVFDVTVYPDAPDGTIISNQAFVSAVDQGLADLPSDDPRTPVPDDPTQDAVGNFPLLFAPKSAALQVDMGTPGIVDPGDVLRYTITVYNNGTVPATAADLTDMVPNDTTYVADSVTLNGQPVGRPDGGVFPLIDTIPISSADLTPPLPGAGEGTLSPGESAVVQFDMQVDAAVPTGTQIVNQATVYTVERPNVLTDGDGNPATGPEPTIVVVGDAQQLTIVKEVSVVNGGAALPGAELEYVVTVRNVGAVPALYVTLYDDLDMVTPGYLTYVPDSATMNGLTAGVVFADTLITADYFNEYGPLDPDQSVVLRFRATINPALVPGTTITNTGQVAWNDPQQRLDASVSIDVGAMPNAGMVSGYVWHDADHDDTPDPVERPLEGWTVELLQDDRLVRSMLTDVDGYYLFANLPSSYSPETLYSIRFSAPGANSTTALLGETDSDFTDGQQRIDEIDVQEGSNLLALNMPVDPNGVVYDSVSRGPVAGATLTLVDVRNNVPVAASCFDDPNHQGQVTVGNGYYKFDINFSDPSCPVGPYYLIQVTPPNGNFIAGISELIPPTSDETTLPFDVPACPGSTNDAVLATSQYCEAQASEFAPAPSVPARNAATDYHFFLRLDDSQSPGSSQLFNNHIPLDPRLGGAVAITKTTPMLNVNRGQLVPYTITVRNSFGTDLQDVTVVDRFPAGFRYVEGSARFDGVETEPAVVGRELLWSDLALETDGRHEIKLLLAVGAGVTEGEFTNRAQVVNSISGTVMSEEAAATVRLVPDPTFDCTDVTGKVFDDQNRNGYQDDDEAGLAGVRVVTARGLAATTDTHGRYHFTCAITPHESRGSNFVLKLDDRSLPSGFRVSTRPVQVQRATRGKALRINFGASIHRVVGLDVADPVFEPGTAEMRPLWEPRINLLIAELQKSPAVLRLSYVADIESESLVERRIDTMKEQIMTAWQNLDCCYELVIESEVFWRLGGPPPKPKGAER